MKSLTSTSVKLDQLIDAVKGLNEMETQQLLEQINYHVSEQSHFPHLLSLFQEEQINTIEELEADVKFITAERDNAIHLHEELVQGIKNLMPNY
jgi:hypothetical protein